jgi:hypothetical protein
LCLAQAHRSPFSSGGKGIDSLRKRLLWALAVDALEPAHLDSQHDRLTE